MKTLRLRLLIIILSFFMAGIPFKTADSQRSGFSISPENPEISGFRFTLNPGESAEDAINAKNFSSDRINMRVEVVQAQTGLNGGQSYDFSNTGGATKWVTINTEKQFELRGSNVKRLPFTVTVPLGTAPGEYTVGFLAALVPTTPTPIPEITLQKGGYFIDSVVQISIPLIIQVPGPENCSLSFVQTDVDVFDAEWRFQTRVKNTGNVNFKGSSSLKITSKENQIVVATATQGIGDFFTGTEMLTHNSLPIPKPGDYSYEFTLTDENHPSCVYMTTGDISYGAAEQDLLATQSILIATQRKPTSTPEIQNTSTPNLIQQVNTPGTIAWYVWLSGVFFLLSIGLIIYALSILKKNKK